MQPINLNEYRPLSLAARVAVALVCFEQFCNRQGLANPVISAYVDGMWELPRLTDYEDWEAHRQHLILDDRRPAYLHEEIARLVSSNGLAEPAFIKLIEQTEDVFLGSMYSAANDAGSLACLEQVFILTSQAGVIPPPVEPFLCSLFSEDSGWGLPVSLGQISAWRYHAAT